MTPLLKQYIDPGFIPHPRRLSDEEYGDVLDSCVLACVDVFVKHRHSVLLGKRQEKPAQGMEWILGGRMLPGERFEEATARITKRESGIVIDDLSRFKFLGAINYVWPDRQQVPQDNGCHMLGLYFGVKVDDITAYSLASTSPDFPTLHWVEMHDIYHNNIQCHPAIHELVHHVLDLPRQFWD